MKSAFCTVGAIACLALIVVGPASAKDFRPGDVRACGTHHSCVALAGQKALDSLSGFYYGSRTPARAAAPRAHSPYLRLLYSDGYVTGVVAGARFNRFLSFGVNTGQFAVGTWYRVPAAVSRELRRLARNLSPGSLPRNILRRSH
ncbi:MAG: hypothetical protein ACRDLM_05905 [Gaiellaceae bacterium]